MIKPGKYRHFKGGEYEVLCMATHSETEEEMVVYRPLYGDHGVWVRPASMWDQEVERDGVKAKRFTYRRKSGEKPESGGPKDLRPDSAGSEPSPAAGVRLSAGLR